MKIEVVETFSGRPNEADDQFIMFLKGAVVDVPDVFGNVVIEKGHAKLADPAPVPQQTEERLNETE